MTYRQWKKNYKKRYGINPPASIDKRKRRKQAARAAKALANADLGEALSRAAASIVNALANAMRALGGACDRAGTAFRNVADNMQPLEIQGRIFSWETREYGKYHYAVYERAYDGKVELRVITNSKRAAEKIAEILETDMMEYAKCANPDCIQKGQDAVDALTMALATACERGVADV